MDDKYSLFKYFAQVGTNCFLAMKKIFESVRDVIRPLLKWLYDIIEPVVVEFVKLNLELINSADDPQTVAKAVTAKKESIELNKEYENQKSKLSSRDMERLNSILDKAC